jgi:hypothetical protein
MAEQLRFEHEVGQPAAVGPAKSERGSTTLVMNESGDIRFADTALARNEHVRIHTRGKHCVAPQPTHRVARTDQVDW